MTPNPAPASAASTSSSTERAQFVCPLTLKEMNGVQPFVYIATCGCVLSQAGLKAVSASTPPADGDKSAEDKDKDSSLDLCPQCATKYDKRTDVRMLNPDPETEEQMRAAMELRKQQQKAGKAKKRKADAPDVAVSSADADDAKAKKLKTGAAPPAPGMNPTIAAASRAVVTSLALEEAKRKAGMSDAVKSLYESKDKGRKETFMTRGTFTRVSVLCQSLLR